VTVFTWTVPPGWTIIGNENSARIEVLAGPGNGEITVRGSNTCGTETATLSVSVSSIIGGEVSITELTGTLSTDLTNVTYQWLQDGVEIPGATNQSYTPTVTGVYSLVVTFQNGCTATSNEIQVTISGLNDIEHKELTVYPNPAKDVLQLIIDEDQNVIKAEIYSLDGRQVKAIDKPGKGIVVKELQNGLYVIRIVTDTGMYVGRFIKD
jgi:hypothetical protein